MSAQLKPHNLPETQDTLNPSKTKQILEAVLLTTQEPLSVTELKKLFDNKLSTALINNLLKDLSEKWLESGIELVNVAGGWRFQTKAEIQPFVDRLTPQKTPRYSRAVMETLAIIAYRQPVTRGDIEDIRGVSVSSAILKTLIARGWIDDVGHRNVPGKPTLFATTQSFLNDLNLRSLEELPPLDELESLVEKNEELPLEEPTQPAT
ncbi:MAG: SMC-Scp complex subunit ScpB [Nitrosomonas sp.]|nr:SMC-Scp complex subunit ScpB [Nitrosomonas sp.]